MWGNPWRFESSPRHKRLTRAEDECYDEPMKKSAWIFVSLILLCVPLGVVLASSQQAYQDYLYQFDVYRQNYSTFTVAKNEYEKFKSLSAQTTALNATKTMLAQRDQLLRSYLLLLNEKLVEDQGLPPSTKQTYQTLLQNEAAFLTTHSQLINAVASIDDATQVSGQLESHYTVLQVTIRQIITGLALGQLSILSHYYDNNVKSAQALISANAGSISSQKLETLNRWILQIQDKRDLFQQKYDDVTQTNAQLTATDLMELDQQFSLMSQGLAQARQYLLEGAQYMIELKDELKYKD